MKKTIQTLVMLCLAFSSVQAQESTMAETLKPVVAQFDTTTVLGTKIPLSAQFDVIAAKYKDQWQPQYYAAYAKAMVSFMMPAEDMAQKDLLLDEADLLLENIVAMNIENDARYVLVALLANARMAVDGKNRYQKYGSIFDEGLKKAKELNADNPHIYYLKGVSLYYTPKMFGGGGKKAKPYLEKAKGLYPKLDKNNVLIPSWGEQLTDYYTMECDK